MSDMPANLFERILYELFGVIWYGWLYMFIKNNDFWSICLNKIDQI